MGGLEGPQKSRRRINAFWICGLSKGQLELSNTNLECLPVRTPELVCWAKGISNRLNTVSAHVKNSWPLSRSRQLLADGQSSGVCWPVAIRAPLLPDLMTFLKVIPLTKGSSGTPFYCWLDFQHQGWFMELKEWWPSEGPLPCLLCPPHHPHLHVRTVKSIFLKQACVHFPFSSVFTWPPKCLFF